MKVTNNSGKIIGVGELPLLPGDTTELPADFDNNPVILSLIEAGKLAKATEPDAPRQAPPAPAPKSTPPPEDETQDKTPGRKAIK